MIASVPLPTPMTWRAPRYVGELALERPDLGTEDVDAAVDHLDDAVADPGAERLERRLGVEQRDGHAGDTLAGQKGLPDACHERRVKLRASRTPRRPLRVHASEGSSAVLARPTRHDGCTCGSRQIPALEPVANRPIVHHVLDAMRSAGVEDVVVAGSADVLHRRSPVPERLRTRVRCGWSTPCAARTPTCSRPLRAAAPLVGAAPCIVHVADGLLDEPLAPYVEALVAQSLDLILLCPNPPPREPQAPAPTVPGLLCEAGVGVFGPGAFRHAVPGLPPSEPSRAWRSSRSASRTTAATSRSASRTAGDATAAIPRICSRSTGSRSTCSRRSSARPSGDARTGSRVASRSIRRRT